MKKFWMVIKATITSSTTQKHESLSEAEFEAKRLCAKEEAPFAILEAIEIVEQVPNPVVVKDIED